MTVALLAGIVFLTAAATPKTFIVGFLSFWYIAVQDRGATPTFDFAGWFGTATPTIVATYAISALLLLLATQLFHTHELRRKW